jgi:hypothetical protein
MGLYTGDREIITIYEGEDMKKLATIRDNENSPCPFGLSILFSCKNAGECVNKMAPIELLGKEADEEEKEILAKANNRVLLMDAPGERCIYMNKDFEDKGKVECNFGSTAPGIKETPIVASPFYSKVYDNVSLEGLFSLPLGQNSLSIVNNPYFSQFSIAEEEDGNKDKIKK